MPESLDSQLHTLIGLLTEEQKHRTAGSQVMAAMLQAASSVPMERQTVTQQRVQSNPYPAVSSKPPDRRPPVTNATAHHPDCPNCKKLANVIEMIREMTTFIR